MKLFLLSFFIAAALFAQENKILVLNKAEKAPVLDGVIDPIWGIADSTDKFVQHDPYWHKEPQHKTTAKVLTTETHIYCLIIAYQPRETIEAYTGMHDGGGGDAVSFMLDSFGDERTAYKFRVSANGVKADLRLLDDARNRDYSWDGIWFSASEIYDWGYVVEIEIPYKSIQYKTGLKEWGVDFDRWIPSSYEDLYWNSYEENEGQRVSKFGKLVFEDFTPSVKGLNLEIYPVAITQAKLTDNINDKYKIEPDAGIDVFYNPSPELTLQITGNPDYAQIEADPYDFNISRYESYFRERRPFFTEGNEVFMPSGAQQNTGFYRPMELFYSRRIGKVLPDGGIVPLLFGAKAFGRIETWEYGGFSALTAETDYVVDDTVNKTEPQALFASGRVKKQILGNSSIGVLMVGKHTPDNDYAVIDIDGAFRTSAWQLAYQIARSVKNDRGDFAASAGFTKLGQDWLTLVRTRLVGADFDINEIGFVPWRGTANLVGLSGPRWYFNEGYITQILCYAGGGFNYEHADLYTDFFFAGGYNMQFRDSWGFEINADYGSAKDAGIDYESYSINLSSWFHVSPKWHGNLWGGYSKTYNFSRDYLAYYSWLGTYIEWQPVKILELGADYNMYIEGKPDGGIEDITYNARPYLSLTPVNDFNVRLYVDNVFQRSSDRMERIIVGFLCSYNFLPKSWIYLAYNEMQDRRDTYNDAGILLPNKMRVQERAAVLKLKYLYYF